MIPKPSKFKNYKPYGGYYVKMQAILTATNGETVAVQVTLSMN